LIVGMGGLDLLPALGRAVDGAACRVAGAGPAGVVRPAQPPSSGPRGRACRLPRDRPACRTGRIAPRDSAPPPPAAALSRTAHRGGPSAWRTDLRTPRRTANGSRPRAPWARLPTIPAVREAVKAGSRAPCGQGSLLPGLDSPGATARAPEPFPAGSPARGGEDCTAGRRSRQGCSAGSRGAGSCGGHRRGSGGGARTVGTSPYGRSQQSNSPQRRSPCSSTRRASSRRA
jgi:hypothetical protein